MEEKSKIQHAMMLEFRNKGIFDIAQKYGYQYLDKAFERNVYPTKEAIDNLTVFDEPMPDKSSDAMKVIDLLNTYGSPATVSQIGGRYFGFVCGSVVPAGLAAKKLATFWDQNTAMYVLSPISSKLENVVEKWLKEIFNLPQKAVAGFVSGSSTANFCGLAAARYRQLKRQGWDVNEKGLFNAPKIRIVTGNHAHSTIIKSIGCLDLAKSISNGLMWITRAGLYLLPFRN